MDWNCDWTGLKDCDWAALDCTGMHWNGLRLDYDCAGGSGRDVAGGSAEVGEGRGHPKGRLHRR
eukprot:9327673-Pyramimonas_sp.AAC.2